MKILMILGTGAILSFPMDKSIEADCFEQGYSILQKLAVYHGPEEKGEDQGWVLKNKNIQVGGWYCQ